MVTTKVTAELEGLVDRKIGEVLCAESDDLTLGDEASELITASVAECAKLNASDFCAD